MNRRDTASLAASAVVLVVDGCLIATSDGIVRAYCLGAALVTGCALVGWIRALARSRYLNGVNDAVDAIATNAASAQAVAHCAEQINQEKRRTAPWN